MNDRSLWSASLISLIDIELIARAGKFRRGLLCGCFPLFRLYDHEIDCTPMALDSEPRQTLHWGFNSPLQAIADHLVQQKLMREVIGNRWWERFKYRIRYFPTEFSKPLVPDKFKKVKIIRESLAPAVAWGSQFQERSTSYLYQRQLVRHRLNKMYNEAAGMDSELHKEEICRRSNRYIR